MSWGDQPFARVGAGISSGERRRLYTIGYGARTLDEFLAVLASHQIEFLVDVRTAPYSKFKQEFSRDLLQHHLEKAGIRYVFMGDVIGGQPKDPACYTDGKVDYDKVRAQPAFQGGVDRLKKAFESRRSVALMCSEGRPEQCHRSKLIGEALAVAGVPVWHIDDDGQLLTQEQVIDRLTQGQMDLFGHTPFSSRKRYAAGENPEENGSDPPHA